MELKNEVCNDIIYGIFLRLPAKSVLRFRCISNIWRDIIDSLPFANMHVSTRMKADEEPQFLPLSFALNYERTVHSYVYDNNVIKKSEYERPILEYSKEYNHYVVEQVAYGLLFFRNRSCVDEIFVCNPLRGEVLELPSPLVEKENEGFAWYGIGFDSIIDSYKILRVNIPSESMYINNGQSRRLSEMGCETKVYTLGTCSWRTVSSSPGNCFMPINVWCALSAYGDTHWKCWDGGNKIASIVSFEFKKEQFKETPLPDLFGSQREEDYENLVLFELKGLLAAVSIPCYAYIDIWVLKDYEKKDWVREYRITNQVFAREPARSNNVVIRAEIRFSMKRMIYEGVCSGGLVFESSNDKIRKNIFVLDLETNQIWCTQHPKSYRSNTRKFSYTGSVLSFRSLGNSIAEIPRKYSFLKTASRVFVSPPF